MREKRTTALWRRRGPMTDWRSWRSWCEGVEGRKSKLCTFCTQDLPMAAAYPQPTSQKLLHRPHVEIARTWIGWRIQDLLFPDASHHTNFTVKISPSSVAGPVQGWESLLLS